VVRALTAKERAGVKYWAQKYVDNSAYCLENAGRISVLGQLEE